MTMCRVRAAELLPLIAVLAACGGSGPVGEELFYGPNGHRLGPEPFPIAPEGPWQLDVEEAFRLPNSYGLDLLFDDGLFCQVEVIEDPYEQLVPRRCLCIATYRFGRAHLEILYHRARTPDFRPFELVENGSRLVVNWFDEGQTVVRDGPVFFYATPLEYVRPPVMFGVEDCREVRTEPHF